MAIEPNSSALRYIRAIFNEGVAAELTDHQLLEQFISRPGPDDSAELAFAALVKRHGPMVLRACRAALRDDHDAQDAFQAVFLVLVHKASLLRLHDSLGPWLHAVALRVSTHARVLAMKRHVHERKSAEMSTRPEGDIGGVPDDLVVAIHEEVGRLPERFRKAVVLCDLEGLTHQEAARRLGWPLGTVKSRQARGRERLRGRLTRRGLAPVSGGMAAVLATNTARAAISDALLASTVKIAVLVARNATTAGAISALTLTATQGVLRAMWLTRLRIAAGVILFLGTAITATSLAHHPGIPANLSQGPADGQSNPPRAKTEAPRPPLDLLRPEDIPADKRFDSMPKNVVAVLGEVRGRHAGGVRGLALSRNGKLLATVADQDMKIRLWDAETLQPRGALAGHRAFVNCVALSSDGRWLASGGAYGDFFLWDMSLTPPKGPTLLPTHGTINKFNNFVHATAFSPDGKMLAVAGDAGSVDLFDMSGAQPVDRGVLAGVNQHVHSLTFSPDGTILAFAGMEDGSARLWDLTTAAPREKATLKLPGAADSAPMPPVQLVAVPGQPVLQPMRLVQRASILSVGFAPDGKTIAALENGGGVRLWDVSRSEPADRGRLKVDRQNLPGNRPGGTIHGLRDLSSVAFSPDGKTLAAAQHSGWIRLWDLKGGEPKERSVFFAHEGPVTGVLSFSPDGKTLFSGGGDHLVRTWDLATTDPQQTLFPHGPIGGLGGGLGGIAFSPDGTKLAVSDAQFVGIWDLSDAQNLSRDPYPWSSLDDGHTDSLIYSPNGKMIISGGDLNTSPEMWDVSARKPRRLGHLSEAFQGIRSLSFASDGETLAAGYNDHKVRIWDMRGPRPKERLVLDGDEQGYAAAAISPNGAYLAFAGPGNSIRLWVLAGLEPRERAVIQGTGWPVSSVAFSPNSKLLAAGTNGGTQLWDISGAKPKELHPTRNFFGFSTSRPINDSLEFSMVFSPDGKWLIAADQIVDKAGRLPSRPAVCVYDVVSGDRLHEYDLNAPCWAIALSPDGRYVAAAQQDCITTIFRLPKGRER